MAYETCDTARAEAGHYVVKIGRNGNDCRRWPLRIVANHDRIIAAIYNLLLLKIVSMIELK